MAMGKLGKQKQLVDQHIVFETSSKAKSHAWKTFCVTTDCENNLISGVADHKQPHHVLAFATHATLSKRKHLKAAEANQLLQQVRESF